MIKKIFQVSEPTLCSVFDSRSRRKVLSIARQRWNKSKIFTLHNWKNGSGTVGLALYGGFMERNYFCLKEKVGKTLKKEEWLTCMAGSWCNELVHSRNDEWKCCVMFRFLFFFIHTLSCSLSLSHTHTPFLVLDLPNIPRHCLLKFLSFLSRIVIISCFAPHAEEKSFLTREKRLMHTTTNTGVKG